jgi:hypothetical protein
MRVVERYRRIDKDTMEVEATMKIQAAKPGGAEETLRLAPLIAIMRSTALCRKRGAHGSRLSGEPWAEQP